MIDIYEAIVQLRREGRRGALATIVGVKGSVPSYAAAKMLVTDEGILSGSVGGGCVEADVIAAAKEVMDSGVPRTLDFDLAQKPSHDTGLICGGKLEIFVEPLLPEPVVYLFGAGHVGHAVYQAARLAELEVVVCDDREVFASRERFPEAKALHAEPMEELLARLAVPPAAYVVICTRGHRDDMRVLEWAVKTEAAYVGMLGSRRKVAGITRALEAQGLPHAALSRVHAPVGLDIGALTPGEIAISIVAELVAIRRRAVAALPNMRVLRRDAAARAGEREEHPAPGDAAVAAASA